MLRIVLTYQNKGDKVQDHLQHAGYNTKRDLKQTQLRTQDIGLTPECEGICLQIKGKTQVKNYLSYDFCINNKI